MSDIREFLIRQLEGLSISEFHVPRGGAIVHNVVGTAEEPKPCGYGSFLEFWEETVGDRADRCFADSSHKCVDGSCADVDEIVGAHVRVDGLPCPLDEAWIVPLCKHCNSDDNCETIHLPEGVVLVPVKMAKKHVNASKARKIVLAALQELRNKSK